MYFEEEFLSTLKSTKFKYLKTHLIKRTFPRMVLKIISAKISWKNFFFFSKKFFSRSWIFFPDCKTTVWASFFLKKKLVLYFFQVRLFNSNILKTCCKNLFRKIEKLILLLQMSQSNSTSYPVKIYLFKVAIETLEKGVKYIQR